MAPSCYLPMPFCPLIDPLSRSVSDSLSLPLLSRKSVYSESLSLFLSGRSLSTCPSIGLCRERDTQRRWRIGGLLCFSLSLSLLLSHTASGDVIGPWPTCVLLDGPHGSGGVPWPSSSRARHACRCCESSVGQRGESTRRAA